MKFARHLKKELIFLKLPYMAKKKIIEYLTGELCKFYNLPCKKKVLENILVREKVKTTGLGAGLAVPHGRVDLADRLYIVFGRSARGIQWGAGDGKPAHYIFLVVGPNRLVREYLDVLGQISRVMVRHNVRDAIKHARQPQEVIQAIRASGIRHRKR